MPCCSVRKIFALLRCDSELLGCSELLSSRPPSGAARGEARNLDLAVPRRLWVSWGGCRESVLGVPTELYALTSAFYKLGCLRLKLRHKARAVHEEFLENLLMRPPGALLTLSQGFQKGGGVSIRVGAALPQGDSR